MAIILTDSGNFHVRNQHFWNWHSSAPRPRRAMIGIRLVEEFNSAAAGELLQILRKGDVDSRLTREASAALQRVYNRDKEP